MQTGVMCYTGYTGGLRDVQATQGGLRDVQAAQEGWVLYRLQRGHCYTGYIRGCDLYRLHMGAVCCTSYTEGAV